MRKIAILSGRTGRTASALAVLCCAAFSSRCSTDAGGDDTGQNDHRAGSSALGGASIGGSLGSGQSGSPTVSDGSSMQGSGGASAGASAGMGATASGGAGIGGGMAIGGAAGGATAGSGGMGGVTGGASGSPAAGSATGGAPTGDGGTGGAVTGGSGFYRMERLNRGVVAVQTEKGVFVSWRMFGFEYKGEATNVAYEVHRDGMRVASVTDSTNYLDTGGSSNATYTIVPVIDGVPGPASEAAKVWTQPYLRIPLEIPPGGTAKCGNSAGEAYTYTANDASAADLDGDGDYEIVLKWDPTNAKDNSQSGCTGNQILDAYDFDWSTGASKRLWRIDLGRNIRSGAHYTQFIVYDLDGDNKAELAVKTAPGTRDGTGAFLKLGPAANDDDNADYRNASGYVLSGPEYLTVFDGLTGAERATVPFDVARGTVKDWGDDYGNRVDRFLAAAAYLDDSGLASVVMARGYYTRTTLTAWNFRDGKLTQLWKFDSNATPRDASNRPYTGQGAHSLSVANVDADPGQEIIYGAMTVDHDGKGKCSTGYNHGDALHVSDLVPSRPGLEAFMPNEDGKHPAYFVRDAGTCAIVFEGPVTGSDTGRGVAADVFPDNPGAEIWASGNTGLLDAATGRRLGDTPRSTNFLIWWDADESRELEDGTTITKWNGTTLLSASGCSSNNGTKSTPTLTADLIGDWREEIIWRESNNAALRLYTTVAVTKRRIYTLMHDPQYRVAIAWQNVAYNQPPHPSFHIGAGMAAPPVPDIHVR